MKFPAWFGRKQREQELDDEIRSHLAMAIRERIERGEDPTEAEANARREFGNVPLVKRNFGLVTILIILASLTPMALGMLKRRRVTPDAGA